jgi:hypothetical protein
MFFSLSILMFFIALLAILPALTRRLLDLLDPVGSPYYKARFVASNAIMFFSLSILMFFIALLAILPVPSLGW